MIIFYIKYLSEYIKAFLIGKSFNFYTKRELRYLLKGFYILKNSSNLDLIQDLKSDLIHNPISKLTFDELLKIPEETCFIQFLNYRRLNFDFTKNILTAHYKKNFKISYGLPFKWRKILREKGYKISFKSTFNWEIFKFLWLILGLYYGFKKIVNFFKTKRFPKGQYVHLFGSSSENISDIEKYYTFFDWLSCQKEISEIKNFTHTFNRASNKNSKNRLINVNDNLPSIESYYNLLIFSIWLLKTFFKGLVKLDPYNIIFIERIDKKIVSLSNKKSLAKYYIFDHQYVLLRPLWTYENISKDFKVILFFYSTNNFTLKFKNKVLDQQFNWELSSWPNYWVWDKSQTTFLNKNCKHKFETQIKGPIPYIVLNKNNLIKSYSPSIVIFDIQPMRKSYYPLIGINNDYYSFETSKVFFENIIEISKELKLTIYIKRKRNFKTTSKEYLVFLDKLKSRNKNIFELDPNTSAFNMLKDSNSLITVNMPYTSTASISQFLKCPSVYYDPLNILDNNYFARGEIKLIQKKHELKKWVKNQISIQNSKTI